MPDFIPLQAALSPLTFQPQHDLSPEQLSIYSRYYGLDELGTPTTQHRLGTVHCGKFVLATHYWLPDGATQTALIVHGYYDHLGLYGHVVRYFLERGYAVLGFDLPGHGLSSGERASITSFDHYGDAIAAVLAAANPLPPVTVALGQSTGCAALLNSLMRHLPLNFERLILLAPLLRPHRWASYGQWVYALLHRWVRHLPRKFNANSHDAGFVDFCQHQDPLQSQQLSVQWVTAMQDWLSRFESQPTLTLPTLLVQGEQDDTVDWRYNVPHIIEKLSACRLEYLPTARHHLVNESSAIRTQLWRTLDDFLQLN